MYIVYVHMPYFCRPGEFNLAIAISNFGMAKMYGKSQQCMTDRARNCEKKFLAIFTYTVAFFCTGSS